MTERYYSDIFGPQHKAASDGLNWLLTRAGNCESKKGFVYIPTSYALDLKTVGEVISAFLGKKPVNELARRKETLIDGVKIVLLTNRKRIKDARGSPLVAFYPPLDDLRWLDLIENVTEMLLIPYVEREARDWIRKWNARPLYDSAPTTSKIVP